VTCSLDPTKREISDSTQPPRPRKSQGIDVRKIRPRKKEKNLSSKIELSRAFNVHGMNRQRHMR